MMVKKVCSYKVISLMHKLKAAKVIPSSIVPNYENPYRVSLTFLNRLSNCQRTFANYETWTVKAIKKNLKKCKWDAARYALHLLADLFNCHVISTNLLL
ncbi:hypothetical protein quinque_012455 [Culex quinquefasciatus]